MQQTAAFLQIPKSTTTRNHIYVCVSTYSTCLVGKKLKQILTRLKKKQQQCCPLRQAANESQSPSSVSVCSSIAVGHNAAWLSRFLYRLLAWVYTAMFLKPPYVSMVFLEILTLLPSIISLSLSIPFSPPSLSSVEYFGRGDTAPRLVGGTRCKCHRLQTR